MLACREAMHKVGLRPEDASVVVQGSGNVGGVAAMLMHREGFRIVSLSDMYGTIHNEHGLGHSGWGGQLIWADPISGTIVAINSTVASELPAPYDHFDKLYHAAIDIVTHHRTQG